MPSTSSSSSTNKQGHPAKGSYSAQTSLRSILELPGRLLFILAAFLGLGRRARQVVHVAPQLPASIKTRDGDSVTLNQWIQTNVTSLKGTFVPTWWLPNGHLQTMYSVVGNFSKVDRVEYKRTYLRVPDGGTLGLDFTPKMFDTMSKDTPTIVVCHGLTGGSHESYVRNILAWVIKPKVDGGLGGRAVVINFRGCAGVPVTSPQFYSAGTTIDLAVSLHYLRSILPHSPLHGIGFSLGASVLSRYLGETGSNSLLSSGAVIGTPWDIPRMSVRLESHWFISRVYSKAMAQNLLGVLFRHYDRTPEIFDDPNAPTAPFMNDLKRLRKDSNVRLKKIDEVMVSRFGGPQNIGLWPFNGADEYYKWASPSQVISGVKRPTLALNAFDDPIVDGASLPLEELTNSSHVYGAISGGGGHLGWFEGNRANDRWVKKPVSEWLIAATRDLPIAGDELDMERDEEGWTWIARPAHAISGIGGQRDGMVGWKVLDGGEVIHGAEGEGLMQGL